MKKFFVWLGCIVAAAGLVGVFFFPGFSPQTYSHATALESIQQQINAIVAAIVRIQARIAELLAETARPAPARPEEQVVETGAKTTPAETTAATSSSETSAVSSKPIWKFISLPSLYFNQPLAIFYRFSITGGTADAIISSVTFDIAYEGVSIKDLEIYAFSDEFFSVPTFLNTNNTKKNRVGKKSGFLEASGQTVSIVLEHGASPMRILAGEIYYFELRGTPVAKNIGAFVTVSAEGLPQIRLE